MTVAAAKKALARSGTAADDIALFLHATTSFQGLDHFTPVSYILDRAVGGTAPALEVKQACNGGMASIEVAAAYLSAMRSGPDSALVTTGDKFNLPGYDRYRSDKGMLRGDGATALVLSRRPGVARLLSTALLDDPTHEGVYRGQGEWASGSGEHGWPVNLRARTKQYLERGQTTVPELVQSITVREQETIHRALADAGITGDEVARFVFPTRAAPWSTGTPAPRPSASPRRRPCGTGAARSATSARATRPRGWSTCWRRAPCRPATRYCSSASAVASTSAAPSWRSSNSPSGTAAPTDTTRRRAGTAGPSSPSVRARPPPGLPHGTST